MRRSDVRNEDRSIRASASALYAVAADLQTVGAAMTASGALHADRIVRAAHAARAAAVLAGEQARELRLLALVALRVSELELAGIVVAHQIGPIPSGLDDDLIDALEVAVESTLDNVVVHARARHVVVNLVTGDGVVGLVVVDDGPGFDLDDLAHPEAQEAANDSSLMRLGVLARALGGALDITTSTGRGTRVEVRVPAPTGPAAAPCTW